jgi:hypothetical protein
MAIVATLWKEEKIGEQNYRQPINSYRLLPDKP